MPTVWEGREVTSISCALAPAVLLKEIVVLVATAAPIHKLLARPALKVKVPTEEGGSAGTYHPGRSAEF